MAKKRSNSLSHVYDTVTDRYDQGDRDDGVHKTLGGEETVDGEKFLADFRTVGDQI